jgi:antitoxin HicB
MITVLYPAHIWHENDVYYVQFLDLENGFTHGNTLEEAKEMAADVLSALLTSYIEHGEPIPKHSEPPTNAEAKNIYLIAPDAKIQAALLLRTARASLSQNDVALSMGTSWQAYQKIEQPTSNTTLSKLQKAARALGRKLILELQ